MRAGELRNRITFQEPVHTRDTFQADVITYTDVVTVWAAIDWESGRRFLEAAQLNAEVQGVVRIRYRDDVKPEWRIKFGDRYFEIISIANIQERRRELQLNVKEAQD